MQPKSRRCNPSRHQNRTRCLFETLPDRTLLSGAVTAALRGDDLIIRGDAADNQIVITQPNPETTRITGKDGTTVNGQPFVDLGEYSDDLRLLMQHGGTDLVSIQGTFDIPDALRAHLGDGELLIEGSFGPVTIGGDLIVHKDAEGATVVRNNVEIGGNVSVTAGGEVSLVAAQASVPDFAAARFDNSLNVNNPYFPVVPGAKWTYKSEAVDEDTGETVVEDIVVEATNDTRTILGVQVRVIRDRVYEEGRLMEDTFDWYAQDNNGNVWYFGEDTTSFEYDDQGNIINTVTSGAWEAGVDGALPGIIMEAAPRVGHQYYQEFAPGDVLDQGVGVATNERASTVLGNLKNVFRSEEYSIIEPFKLANKLYAPGVGTVTEFDLDIDDDKVNQTTRLVSLTLNGRNVKQLVKPTGFTGQNATGRVTGSVDVGGKVDILARGGVILNNANVSDELRVHTEEDAVLIDTALSENATFTADTLSLKRVFAEGTIRIGGRADAVIFDSDIHSFKARFGGAANDVSVRNSTFDNFDADGGPGSDSYDDLGNNDFGRFRLRNFTRI